MRAGAEDRLYQVTRSAGTGRARGGRRIVRGPACLRQPNSGPGRPGGLRVRRRGAGRGRPLGRGSSCPTSRAVCGIMWVTFGHLRPSGHIMPDHAGDRGAVFLVLAPHDHLASQAEADSSAELTFLLRPAAVNPDVALPGRAIMQIRAFPTGSTPTDGGGRVRGECRPLRGGPARSAALAWPQDQLIRSATSPGTPRAGSLPMRHPPSAAGGTPGSRRCRLSRSRLQPACNAPPDIVPPPAGCRKAGSIAITTIGRLI
jgi:hypothetical protein